MLHEAEIITRGLMASNISQAIKRNISADLETKRRYLNNTIAYFDSILSIPNFHEPFMENSFQEHILLNSNFKELSRE